MAISRTTMITNSIDRKLRRIDKNLDSKLSRRTNMTLLALQAIKLLKGRSEERNDELELKDYALDNNMAVDKDEDGNLAFYTEIEGEDGEIISVTINEHELEAIKRNQEDNFNNQSFDEYLGYHINNRDNVAPSTETAIAKSTKKIKGDIDLNNDALNSTIDNIEVLKDGLIEDDNNVQFIEPTDSNLVDDSGIPIQTIDMQEGSTFKGEVYKSNAFSNDLGRRDRRRSRSESEMRASSPFSPDDDNDLPTGGPSDYSLQDFIDRPLLQVSSDDEIYDEPIAIPLRTNLEELDDFSYNSKYDYDGKYDELGTNDPVINYTEPVSTNVEDKTPGGWKFPVFNALNKLREKNQNRTSPYIKNFRGEIDDNMSFTRTANAGRKGDSKIRLVDGSVSHVNPKEAFIIDTYGNEGEKLTKKKGSGTINPKTGLPEYFEMTQYPEWSAGGGIFGDGGNFNTQNIKNVGASIGKNMDMGLAAINMIAGAASTTKANKAKKTAIKGGIDSLRTESHSLIKKNTDDLKTLQDSKNTEFINIGKSAGDNYSDLNDKLQSYNSKSGAMDTGSLKIQADKYQNKIAETSQDARDKVDFSVGQKKKDMSRSLSDSNLQISLSIKDLEDELDMLRGNDEFHENLFG